MALISLDTGSLIVDATLTKRGRELLTSGNGKFNITKFAISDDEIDYNLTSEQIEKLPLREASINGDIELRHKLISNANQNVLTVAKIVNINYTSIELNANEDIILEPKTSNGTDMEAGYVVTLSNSNDSTYPNASLTTLISTNTLSTNTQYIGIGTKFRIVAKESLVESIVNVSITGRESGATTTFAIKVLPLEINGTSSQTQAQV